MTKKERPRMNIVKHVSAILFVGSLALVAGAFNALAGGSSAIAATTDHPEVIRPVRLDDPANIITASEVVIFAPSPKKPARPREVRCSVRDLQQGSGSVRICGTDL